MKRYLFISSNDKGYRPNDRDALLNMLRCVMRAANIRVASKHIEVEIWNPDLPLAMPVMRSTIGEPIAWKPLEEDTPFQRYSEELRILEEFAYLFNEERFWEAHGVLESTWRSSGDKALQGLILVAASFIKIQEGRPSEFELIARRALETLSGYSKYLCIDIDSIKKGLERALRSREPFKIDCIR